MNKDPAHRPSFIDWSAELLDTSLVTTWVTWMRRVESRKGIESSSQVKNDVGINHGELKNNIKREHPVWK